MSSLLEPGKIEQDAERVKREIDRLVELADGFRDRHDAATESGDTVAASIVERRLAGLVRQLTRAQALLVHPSDPRYSAAQAVLGYCDEADQVERPWGEPIVVTGLDAAA